VTHTHTSISLSCITDAVQGAKPPLIHFFPDPTENRQNLPTSVTSILPFLQPAARAAGSQPNRTASLLAS